MSHKNTLNKLQLGRESYSAPDTRKGKEETNEVSKEEREMYKAKQNLWYELRHPVQVLACTKVPPPHPSFTPSHT